MKKFDIAIELVFLYPEVLMQADLKPDGNLNL